GWSATMTGSATAWGWTTCSSSPDLRPLRNPIRGTTMRKLIYYVAVTLDGYIAAPDGGFDFFPLEGDHGPWIVENYPESVPGHVREHLGLAETPPPLFATVLMGRATPQVAVDDGAPDRARPSRGRPLPRRRASRPGRDTPAGVRHRPDGAGHPPGGRGRGARERLSAPTAVRVHQPSRRPADEGGADHHLGGPGGRGPRAQGGRVGAGHLAVRWRRTRGDADRRDRRTPAQGQPACAR